MTDAQTTAATDQPLTLGKSLNLSKPPFSHLYYGVMLRFLSVSWSELDKPCVERARHRITLLIPTAVAMAAALVTAEMCLLTLCCGDTAQGLAGPVRLKAALLPPEGGAPRGERSHVT